MKRKDIDQLLQTHTRHREFALHHLKQILESGESNGQEIRWTKLLIIHTAMVDALNKEIPDDE